MELSLPRKLFFRLLCATLVIATIYYSWQGAGELPAVEANRPDPYSGSIEERVLIIQTKLIIGLKEFLEEKRRDGTGTQAFSEEMLKEIETAYFANAFQVPKHPPPPGAELSFEEAVLLRKYVVAKFLGFEEEALALAKQFTGESEERFIPQLVIREKPLTDEELVRLTEHLGWFGTLHAYSLGDEERKQELDDVVYYGSLFAFKKFVVASAFITVFALLSLLSAGIFFYRLHRGKFRFKLNPLESVGDFSLEIFTLYMLSMFVVSQVVVLLVSGLGPRYVLGLNVVFIAGFSLLIFWPVLFGVSFSSVRKALGLRLISWRSFFGDLFAAPFVYLATWTILLVVIVPYLLVIEALGVDLSKGTHPVVPVLLKVTDAPTILLVLLLGVVIAPAIEELMFRGALYSWLRARLGIFPAILTSAMIFAAVHPQGIVGLLPLTVIGAMLAFLREWRGSLLAPILAHACVNAGTFFLLFYFLKGG